MKYELREVDEIVSIYLKPRNFGQQPNLSTAMENLQEVMVSEKERICELITEALFTNADEEVKRQYIKRHQTDIVQMMNVMDSYLDETNPESIHAYMLVDHGGGYRNVAMLLFKIYLFLYRNCQPYFSINEPIPNHMRMRNSKLIKSNAVNLEKRLDVKCVRKDLKPIVLLPFVDFSRNKNVSFYRLRYLLNYRKKLSNFLNEGELNKSKVLEFLAEQEMNAVEFRKYYTTKVTLLAKKLLPPVRKANYYSYHLKLVHQLTERSVSRYDLSLRPVKEQIACWLREELNFLGDARQLSPIENSTTSLEEPNNKRIKFETTVAAIACWVRLAKGIKLVDNVAVTELLRATAIHFRSKKSADLSEKSLENHFYSPDRTTLQQVKDQLIGMLNFVNRL